VAACCSDAVLQGIATCEYVRTAAFHVPIGVHHRECVPRVLKINVL